MQRFFVSGYNKSGTTFLQMLLDAHPNINCPSEHHFHSILKYLVEFSKHYRRQLELFDSRTANQGIRFDEQSFTLKTLRSILLIMMDFGVSEATTHSGLNDNSLINNGDLFAGIIPDAAFVFIVRNPREIGVSLWHHKRRTEPDFAASDTSIDTVISVMAEAWPQHIGKIISFRDKHPKNTHIVRYEDLVSKQRDQALSAILDFMEVSYDAANLERMWNSTDFSRLQSSEKSEQSEQSAGFFRSGKTDSWRGAMTEQQTVEFTSKARAELAYFGYPME